MDDQSPEKRARMLALMMKMADARVRGQFDVLESAATEDVVVRLVGTRSLSPFGGTFKGRPAARAALERLSVEFEYRDLKLQYIMIDGDQVGMRWLGTLRNRGTNAQAQFEGFVHVVLENELVKEYVCFLDTAAVAELAEWDRP